MFDATEHAFADQALNSILLGMAVKTSEDAPRRPDIGAPHVPSPARSQNMAAIRRADTKPERELRSALHARGLRFRKDYPIRVQKRLIRPDIAFTRLRLAVFWDGCFWHSCPAHGHPPKSNTEYWNPKLARNAARDELQTQLLESDGWAVLRIWGHTDIESAAENIEQAVLTAREQQAAKGLRRIPTRPRINTTTRLIVQ